MKPCGKCMACIKGAPDECYDPVFSSYQHGEVFTDRELADTLEYDSATSGYSRFSTTRRSDLFFDEDFAKTKHKGKKSKGYFEPRCSHSHKPLLLKEGIVIHGGTASDPLRKDHDIYISLDKYSAAPRDAAYPWQAGWKNAIHILYPISDMSVPTDPVSFKAMVNWIVEQLYAGKSVHAGCLGGHGRTGMLLAAVVKVMTGNEDAITYVREHYCHKAVETATQVEWLHKHFGIKVVAGTKNFLSPSFTDVTGRKSAYGVASRFNETYANRDQNDEVVNTIEPVSLAGNIWGASL